MDNCELAEKIVDDLAALCGTEVCFDCGAIQIVDACPKRLAIVIEAGETTCTNDQSKRCSFVLANPFCCGLFGKPLAKGRDGWLQRLPECIEAEMRPPAPKPSPFARGCWR